ncbi:MAG: dihydropteroate synthase [Thermoplasmata archaeon]|nr:dihydropteroate synthase [Thermoplasmata archaeon]
MHARFLSKNADLADVFGKIGVHPEGIEILRRKAETYRIYVSGINPTCANIIKQEMLAAGGDAAIPMEAITGKGGNCDVVLLGTEKCLKIFLGKLRKQPFNLSALATQIERMLEARRNALNGTWKTSKRILKTEIPLIMGILNITPDSFSDGGCFLKPERAIERAKQMIQEGADIIDVGAESTRPGSEPVSAEEEIKRLSAVLDEIISLGKPVSVDTYKPEVAKFALERGAEIINDVYGLRREGMAEVVARYGAGVCIMHMLGEPKTMQENPVYTDLIADIYRFLGERIEFAEGKGIAQERMVIDPGIGFGKTVAQNYEIVARLEEFLSLGCPLLLGTSRKSFIGKVIDVPPAGRICGTVAINMVALMNGARILRVHDVREHAELVELYKMLAVR